MAGRQFKVSLPYFELDCHMDEKVKLIRAEYGLKGFAVVVMMYQHIYGGDHGYYCEWDDERLLLFMSDNGLIGESRNLIDEVVHACIRREIFSERLYEKYGILTSHGVQKQYLKATAKREAVNLIREYLLISVPENRSNVVINSISDGKNSISGVKNSQRKSERKSERDIKENARVNRIEDFISAYPKGCNRYLTEQEYVSLLLAGKVTEDDLVQCALNYADACSIRGTECIYNAENFLGKFVFEQYLPGKYRKPASRKPGNRFNDFQQNTYDFEDLEKKLLQNGDDRR